MKHAVKRALQYVLPPQVYECIRRVWYTPRIVRCSALYNRFRPGLVSFCHPGEILWVATDQISETALNYEREDQRNLIGAVRGGDWDLVREKVYDLRVLRFLTAHFRDGVDLRDTAFYNPHIATAAQQAATGSHTWDFITAYEYDDRMKRIHSLYECIQRDGYKTQTELGGDPLDEIIVKIGRHGEILFVNSIHRFSIAKILGVPKIPVIVSVRHRDWMTLRRQLIRYADHLTPEGHRAIELYHRLAHPDLQSLPCKHDSDDRLAMITDHLHAAPGSTVLDIGAHLGYFSFALANAGYVCDAVEYGVLESYFLRRLTKVANVPVTVLTGNVLALGLGLRPQYDVGLALNVFHHFLKEKRTTEQLIEFLSRIRMDEIFFIPHCEHERPMQSAYLNLSRDEFVEFVKAYAKLPNHECVGEVIEGRTMFHLWR